MWKSSLHLYSNFYTSPAVFAELMRLRLGFEACGSLCLNHPGLPPEIKALLKKGEVRNIQAYDHIAIVQRHDECTVSMLLIVHGHSPVPVKRRSRDSGSGHEVVEKQQAVVEYKFMGGVDGSDQLLCNYGFPPHLMVKWWRRAFLS